MDIAIFRVDRRKDPTRVSRKRLQATSGARPEWLELAKETVVYFGATLLPLVLTIVLYELGLIA
jgi:hypothetical protein